MTEQTKQAPEPTQANPAPEGAQAPAADLSVQDLGVIKQIIDVATQRGAFKANEMQAVGTTYNKLESFLKVVEAQQKPAAGKPDATTSATQIKDAGTQEKK
jgi:hypothetical protein